MNNTPPEYPVVYPNPTFDDVVKTTNFGDLMKGAAITSATWCYGYVYGKPVRIPSANTAAAIGFTFAGFYMMMDKRMRLMGIKPNDGLVKAHGTAEERMAAERIQT
mmetsp:Transcript_28884/g.29239  ORF Transcript_28884/g.29239 Transcript_28884/m.29239 type:complete len:106 (-) Transcript_28884:251-568(-)